MCWNETVSMNTFLFSVGMLGLMIYNNNYTQYKIIGFNIYWYFFILSFCSMQLIEFFLWRNLNNKKMNKFWSMMGQFLVAIQPIASLMLLKNDTLKYFMIFIYTICISVIFAVSEKVFKTTTYNGRLKWSWITVSNVVLSIWLFFLLFSFMVNQYYIALFIAFVLFAITYYSNLNNGTGGSLWCWTINFTMIFYAFYLLIFLPFKEHGIC